MTYDIMEILVYALSCILGLVFVAGILNRQVIKDIMALKRSVRDGTGMAIDKATTFFDSDGDGDVDIDDIKYMYKNVNISDMRAAVEKELQQREYAEAGAVMDLTKQKDTSLMFKDAVGNKSKGN